MDSLPPHLLLFRLPRRSNIPLTNLLLPLSRQHWVQDYLNFRMFPLLPLGPSQNFFFSLFPTKPDRARFFLELDISPSPKISIFIHLFVFHFPRRINGRRVFLFRPFSYLCTFDSPLPPSLFMASGPFDKLASCKPSPPSLGTPTNHLSVAGPVLFGDMPLFFSAPPSHTFLLLHPYLHTTDCCFLNLFFTSL